MNTFASISANPSPRFSARFCTRQGAKVAAGASLITGGAVSLGTLAHDPISAQAASDAHHVAQSAHDAHEAADAHGAHGGHGTHGAGHGGDHPVAAGFNYLNALAMGTVVSGPIALGSSAIGSAALGNNGARVQDPKVEVELPSHRIGTLKAQLNEATQAQQELDKTVVTVLRGDLNKAFGGVTVQTILTSLFHEKPVENHQAIALKLRTVPALKKALEERLSVVGEPQGLIAHIQLHFTKKRVEKELTHHVQEGLMHLEATGMAKPHLDEWNNVRFTVLTPLGVTVRNKLLAPPSETREKDTATVELTPG